MGVPVVFAVLVTMAVAGLVSACASSFLPKVSDDVVESVEGENVVIVARNDEPNPGDDWIDTRVVVEVGGPRLHIDEVEAVLAANGWNVREAATVSAPLLLTADQPGAGLVVLMLDDFISMGIRGPSEAFSDIETKPERSYFVITIMPYS
jgi:hypothetical protein